MPRELIEFVGRLHLVLLHAPIGLVIAALVSEVLLGPFQRVGERKRSKKSASGVEAGGWRRPCSHGLVMLGLGTVASLLAAGSGWLYGEEFQSGRVQLHRWVAIGATAGVVVTLAAGVFSQASGSGRWLNLYRVLLVVSAGGIGLTGHLGGGLVHGAGFVYQPLVAFVSCDGAAASDVGEEFAADSAGDSAVVPLDVSEGDAVFGLTVLPALERSCVGCHGPSDQKSGFRLDSRAYVLESGTVVPGDTFFSSIVERVELPRDDVDAMPPRGEAPPLTGEEIAALKSWIEGLSAADDSGE